MFIILDIIAVGLIILFAVLGAVKGFAKTLIEVVGYILAFVIAFSVAEYVADYIYENNVKETIVASVSDITKESADNAVVSISDSVDKIWESIPSYISAFSGITKESVTDYVETYSDKTDEGIEQLATSVSENVIKPVVVSAIELVVSILLIIILLFIVKILAKLIGNIFNKSVFKGMNRFLGFISGATKGLLFCLAIAAIISIVLPLFDNEFYFISPDNIEKTFVFKLFYNFVIGI